MSNYEAQARATELRGKAEAARIRAHGFENEANRASNKTAKRVQEKARGAAYIQREVDAGRMCPGGCDTDSGGCRRHASSC